MPLMPKSNEPPKGYSEATKALLAGRKPVPLDDPELGRRFLAVGKPKCVACEGSGKSSRGGICSPCAGTGTQGGSVEQYWS